MYRVEPQSCALMFMLPTLLNASSNSSFEETKKVPLTLSSQTLYFSLIQACMFFIPLFQRSRAAYPNHRIVQITNVVAQVSFPSAISLPQLEIFKPSSRFLAGSIRPQLYSHSLFVFYTMFEAVSLLSSWSGLAGTEGQELERSIGGDGKAGRL